MRTPDNRHTELKGTGALTPKTPVKLRALLCQLTGVVAFSGLESERFGNSITAELLRVVRAPVAPSSSAVVAELRKKPAALMYTCSIDGSFCLQFSVLCPTRISLLIAGCGVCFHLIVCTGQNDLTIAYMCIEYEIPQ